MKNQYIIVIDDDPEDREFFNDALEDLHLDVPIKFFEDGDEAFNYLKSMQFFPYLILCDINRPGINGFEFRELIKNYKEKKLVSIPFVFVSTTASPTMYRYATDLNIQGYFQKPGNYDDFKLMISNIISYWNDAYEAINEAV